MSNSRQFTLRQLLFVTTLCAALASLCASASLNLPPEIMALYYGWLATSSVLCVMLLSRRDIARRWMMCAGFAAANVYCAEGVGYVYHLAGVCAAAVLLLLIGSQGAILAAMALAAFRGIMWVLAKRPVNRNGGREWP